MLIAAITVGAAVSTARPAGIIAALLLPDIALRQRSRRSCYLAATGYYAAALWPLGVGAKNFFGPDVSVLVAIAFWALCAVLLALPYALLWTERTRQMLWRAPLAVLIGIIPPLGLIGFASPVTASGFLFPAWSWAGVALALAACGLIAVYPRFGILSIATVSLVANLLYSGARQPPPDWGAVDTHFGGISHGQVSALREYLAAEQIQGRAVASPAKVIVFPESVVPRWTTSTDLFWKPAIDALRRNGKTVVVGALLPESLPVRSAEFGAAVNLLRTAHELRPVSIHAEPYSYQNAAIVRGAERGVFFQRVPVPVSVWKPFSRGGAPLHLAGPAVLDLAGQRAAVLICYEQVIPWTVLTAAAARPTVFVGMSNDYWATGTPIPRWQKLCLRAWGRLFRVPYLLAVNT